MEYDNRDSRGSLLDINVPNLKVSRKAGEIINDEDYIIKSVPITAELKGLLIEMGLNEYLGQERYMLTPERYSRSYLKEIISKAFTHYFKQLNMGKSRILNT